MSLAVDNPILNNPFGEPKEYWIYEEGLPKRIALSNRQRQRCSKAGQRSGCPGKFQGEKEPAYLGENRAGVV